MASHGARPGLNWPTWYNTQSGYTADETHFGAYVMWPSDNNLFIGLGSGRPAELDGALIAVYDGVALRALGSLTEQGVNEMVMVGETLHIAGADPCCGDGWEAGNHYTATAVSPPQKYRDPSHGLTNVLHTWALWANEQGDLYAATSAHEFQVIWRGQIWRSQDGGQHWQLLSNLGNYRVYDVTGFQGHLYALYTNAANDSRNTLAYSADGGLSWQDLVSNAFQRIHLTEFKGQLVGVSYDRTAVYALTTPQTITRYQLPPGYTIGSDYDDAPGYANYNLLAVAGPYLYTVLARGDTQPMYNIVRSQNLQSWEVVHSTRQPIIAMAYWPAKNSLIWATNGRYASLWQLNQATNPLFPTSLSTSVNYQVKAAP
jgi:hypothetical protein